MLTTSPETSGQCEEGVLGKGIWMGNVCRFLYLWDTLGEMNYFFFLISVGGKHLRKLTLQYGEIPQLNFPGEITLYKEALEDKYWDPSKAGSGENHRQNHRCRSGRVRCPCSFKIPVHNAEGLSGGVETRGPAMSVRNTRSHNKPRISICINMYLRAEHRNRVCPKGWNTLRLFMLKLLSLANLECLCTSPSDYNIFHFNNN